MSKPRLKLYLSCIAFIFCPIIESPAFAISNQSALSLARENYPIVTSLEDYPSITLIQESNVEVALGNITLEKATGNDEPSVLEQALKLGEEATEQAEVADSREDWDNVSRKWLKAIELLLEASQDETKRSEASQRIEEFQKNLADSTSQFFTLISGEETPLPRARVGMPLLSVPLDESSTFQKERSDYNAWVLTHRKNTLRISLYSSMAIFALVVVIVIAGILLSYEQLRKGLSSETKFSVKGGTVEISSSIIGFFVLSLSLAFFYLYLQKVYPIQEIGGVTDNNSSSIDVMTIK